MKKLVSLMMALALLLAVALAEYAPSYGAFANVAPNHEDTYDDGMFGQLYFNVSDSQLNQFISALVDEGCEVVIRQYNEGTLYILMQMGADNFYIMHHPDESTLFVLYPENLTPRPAGGDVEAAPVPVTYLPSYASVMGVAPDSEEDGGEGIFVQIYYDVTEDQLDQFVRAMGELGYQQTDIEYEDGMHYSRLIKDGVFCMLAYEPVRPALLVLYFEGYAPEPLNAAAEQACASCGGSGICAGCKGAGSVGVQPCTSCGGSGICADCEGR